MISRFVSLVMIAWALGFVWFASALPQPAGSERTDGVVVLTGAPGRIDRGLEALRRGWADQLFVSGVDREVKPHEFAAQYKVRSAMMACCVTLGFEATDTRGNGRETGAWVRSEKIRTLRVVTNDWHMRRAELELRRNLPGGIELVADAVPSHPSLRTLFLEYNKLLARAVIGLVGG